jgi:hypothetical protein
VKVISVGDDVYISYEEGIGYNVTPARVVRKQPIRVNGHDDVVLTVRPHGRKYALRLLGSTLGVS